MVRTDEGLSYPTIPDCQSIPDGFEKLDAYLRDHNYRPGDSFTVVFPRFAWDSPSQERTLLEIAHLVLAQTGPRRWQFSRDVPPAPTP
jgi:hypothetical protein